MNKKQFLEAAAENAKMNDLQMTAEYLQQYAENAYEKMYYLNDASAAALISAWEEVCNLRADGNVSDADHILIALEEQDLR